MQIIYYLVIFCTLNDLWNGFEFLKGLWSKLITHLYKVLDVDLLFFLYRCISLTGRHTMTCVDFILVIIYSSWEGRMKKSLLLIEVFFSAFSAFCKIWSRCLPFGSTRRSSGGSRALLKALALEAWHVSFRAGFH